MEYREKLNDYHKLMRSIYVRCRQMEARIAVVGTGFSALVILETIRASDLTLAGLFEAPEFHKTREFMGHPIQPLERLAELKPDDVVVVASSLEAYELETTFKKIYEICPNRVVHLKTLTDLSALQSELREPLKFKFDEYLFGRGYWPIQDENNFWMEPPPGVDFADKVVLELGPCEGNQSVMLVAQKPKKIIGIEARPLNYAKHAVIQSLYQWKNYELLLGDIHLFPEILPEPVDIIYCFGVLYHSIKPWWLLQNCLDHCDTILLETHVAGEGPGRNVRRVDLESGTFEFEVYREQGWEDSLSGTFQESLWFREEDLVRFIRHNGFSCNKYKDWIDATGRRVGFVLKREAE